MERVTRFAILLHLPGDHNAETIARAMIREMGKLPDHLRQSAIWDRGTELAEFARFQTAVHTTLYFCDPYSPWQRGTNENTNRLLRSWFEEGSDLSLHTPDDLRGVAAMLNRGLAQPSTSTPQLTGWASCDSRRELTGLRYYLTSLTAGTSRNYLDLSPKASRLYSLYVMCCVYASHVKSTVHPQGGLPKFHAQLSDILVT